MGDGQPHKSPRSSQVSTVRLADRAHLRAARAFVRLPIPHLPPIHWLPATIFLVTYLLIAVESTWEVTLIERRQPSAVLWPWYWRTSLRSTRLTRPSTGTRSFSSWG